MTQLGERLHARGMRLTRPRQRVLDAVTSLAHATPEEVHARVLGDGGPELPPSTIYRCLGALEELGMLRHTHLDHRAPSYQLAEHGDHIHLVCRECGAVDEVSTSVADSFAAAVLAERGFAIEVDHTAVHGRCVRCLTS